MSTTITYDDFTFTGVSGFPTPYVSRNQEMLEYGNRWGQGTSYTLNGQITGHNFDDIIYKQNVLLSGFSRDFKSLNITEEEESIAGFPAKNCKINNISFDSSKYGTILNYSIDIDTYDETLFSGHYGVIDPNNQINFSETNEGIINVDHEVSAKGIFANNKSPIENAENFVRLHSGWNNAISPYFIKYSDKLLKYNSIFTDNTDPNGWSATHGSLSSDQTIDGKGDCLKYVATNENSDTHYVSQTFSSIEVGKKYRIYAEIYIDDNSYQDINTVEISNSATAGDEIIVQHTSQGSWSTMEGDFTAVGSTVYIKALDGIGDYLFQGDSSNNDWFAVKNIKIEELKDFTPILLSQNESFNRMDGSYTISERYSSLKTGDNLLMSGNSIDISSGLQSEFISVELSTTYKGHFGQDIDDVRSKIPNLNSQHYYQLATGLSNITTLHSGATDFSVSENSGSSLIEVQSSFSNNPMFGTGNSFLDYNVSFNTNELTLLTSVGINAEIICAGSNKKDKLISAENFLTNVMFLESGSSKHEAKYVGYLYNRANEEYAKLSKPYSLRPYPVSCNIQKDRDNGIITLNASFDDDYQYSDNLKKSSWAISVTPPLRKYEPTSDVITYPKHIIWNTNVVRRSRIQVNSNASAYNSINKSFGLTSLENFATSVYNTYVNPNSDIAEMQDSVNFNERSLNYNKVKSWGFHNTNSESEWVKFPSPDKP